MLCMFLDQMIFSREQLPPQLSPAPSLPNVAASVAIFRIYRSGWCVAVAAERAAWPQSARQ